jgi:putative endopeptidase
VIQRLATDPHSPSEFRANQILKNIDAFYEAFGVKQGDGMWLDPAERVRIW